MDITFKVVSYHRLSPDQESEKTFSGCNFTMGRSLDNDWVLPDPERIISGQHATVTYTNGHYYINDTSTNGLFINKSETPLGHGNSARLHDGDHITLGEYELDIELSENAGAQPSQPAEQDPMFAGLTPDNEGNNQPPAGNPPSLKPMDFGEDDNFFQPPEIKPQINPQPVSTPVSTPNILIPDDWNAAGSTPAESSRLDSQPAGNNIHKLPPFDDIDLNKGKMSDNELGRPIEIPEPIIPEGFQPADSTPSNSNKVEPVNNISPIRPEPPAFDEPNFDQSSFDQPSFDKPDFHEPAFDSAKSEIPEPIQPMPPVVTPEADNQPAQAKTPPQQSATPQSYTSSASDSQLLEALIRGLGVDPSQMPDNISPEFMETTGKMLRGTVEGVMEILRARTNLKSEFRANQTMIRPAENNPLKFSPSFEDAMNNLFVKTGQSYLPPLKAMEEAIIDIKTHQLALMAGFQGALTSLLDKFEPENIISHASKSIFNTKANYWEQYKKIHHEVRQEAEDNVQKLLGEEFARAYEQQSKGIKK